MIKYDFEVFLPTDKDLIKKYGLGSDGKIQKVVDASFIHYMRLNMPYDSGIMAGNTRATRPGLVEVQANYAHYINTGILYVNPEHNSTGWPFIVNGEGAHVGYKGKRVPTNRHLKNYYETTGGPGKGAHFVERTINNDKEKIVEEAQREVNKCSKK